MITGSMIGSDYHASPTLFYPPPPSTEYLPATGARVVSYSPSPEPQPLSRPPLRPQRSRKRSRDQAEDDDREAAFHEMNTMDTSVSDPEPILGEGMVLVDPQTGLPVGNGASSSTGTWHEQQLEEQRRASEIAAEQLQRDQEEMAKAINRPVKAQRIDLAGIVAQRGGSPSTAPGMIEPTPLTPVTPAAPAIDETAMMLGVGWSRVDGSLDSALAGARKGWARYIDKHFGTLSYIDILAKSDSKEAFLVKAFDGVLHTTAYYLFSDSLEQGQLLACDLETAVTNLQAGVFAGQLMTASQSPTPEPAQLPSPVPEVEMEI